MYVLVRPLLFRLDPEQAHHVGLSVASAIAKSPSLAGMTRRIAGPVDDCVDIAGLSFPNRIGLAAGLDKNAVAPLAWWAFGFGFMELGTITPRPQAGNDRPRLFRLPQRRALLNRMGFNNDGAEMVAERLARQKADGHRPPCPIGISIGKNKVTPAENAADDYRQCAERLGPLADYLAVNISSPNTPGLRDLQTAAEVGRLIDAVRGAAPRTPVFVKLAPELEGDTLIDILKASADRGAAGIIASNTVGSANVGLLGDSTLGAECAARLGGQSAGLSGAPVFERAVRQVAAIRKHLDAGMALIGCGGIGDATAATAMLNAGADLIQVYSALIYRGPFLPARLSRGIARGGA